MWKIPKTTEYPIYQQIIALIETHIQDGHLLPGDKLPPERDLAALLGVNRSTLVHALDELSTRGIITRKQGSGTRISEDKWGVFTGRKTNWRHYVSQGAFLQATPYLDKMKLLRSKAPDAVIDVASGELPVDLLPEITTPALSWQTFLSEESSEDVAGYKPLRATIQEMVAQNYHVTTNLDQIFITSGAQQALFLITQCLLTSGDAIAMEAPSYFYALSLFQSAGLRIYALPMDHEGVKLAELEQLYRKHRIKMVFVNPTFQNPTSLTMSAKRRQEFVALCSKIQVPIVEDDPYSLLTFDESEPPELLKKLDPDNVLYIGSLSKLMGSTTRIGWLIGPAAVVTRLAEARQEMDFGLSIFPQVLANHVLSDAAFGTHIGWLRKKLQQRRDALIKHLPESLQYDVPQGGFHLWCRLPQKDWKTRDFDIFLEQQLLVMPAFLFGIQESAIRLTFAKLDEADAPVVGERLRGILEDE
ncbi:PLP-dependent aminotransferase family protein [Listeria grandensis]|uniref:PLP-dependent aminotransferase family protein n=1 Tax=Listeria grandensis TaxID=1494963 RepID=A0A7X0Y368_9LIST|nr:PLP-dependent aminotransferase family protein [Listeria grandensis]MBC1936180.1 PLP-dependent aminotransferase family protein [Listeria grandensis]